MATTSSCHFIYQVSQRNAADSKNCNIVFSIYVIKRLVFLKSAIIRLIFDIFSSIFGGLAVKLESANFKIAPRSKPELLQ